MKKVCAELSSFYNVQTNYLVVDLSHFPSNQLTANKFEKIIEDTLGNDNLSLVMCNAGMSDLARHFTDISLERNIDLMNLNMTANITIIQTLLPFMIKSYLKTNIKSGLMITSALTGFLPIPTFALSTANKMFLRQFVESIRYEFREYIKVMVSNPIAVESNILKGKHIDAITPTCFTKGVLDDFSKGFQTSSGILRHDFELFCYKYLIPSFIVPKMYFYGMAYNSRLLERPVDTRPLEEKLQLANF